MKTICVYHSRDLDGWMSAAIVKYWFGKTYPKYDGIDDLNEDSHSITPPDEETTGERLTFLGWDYGDNIPDLSEYDKVIMCDISFPKEEMEEIYKAKPNSIYIDHHISAIKELEKIDQRIHGEFWGLRSTKYAACELTWKYFFPNEEMPEIVRLLGRYDCFGHKGTDEEQKVLEFQYGARQAISNYEEAYKYLDLSLRTDTTLYESPEDEILEGGQYIYKYLCAEAKQTYKKAFEARFQGEGLRNGFVLGSKFIPRWKFLCVNQERFNPINFGIDYHKDGYDGFACFWFENGQWSFSLYNDNGEVDVSQIAKQYGGGGHKGAAGFRIDDLYKILDENN